jgi:predicted HAD superfamily Cof-like phosphohydrolase
MSLHEIENWHQSARPHPTAENFNVQLGCHFEEIAEMLEALNPCYYDGVEQLQETYTAIKSLADNLKSGELELYIPRGQRKGFLDALADQVVTGVGVGHCAGMDVPEACARVDLSNWSKFVDGKPVFKENGKIDKGSDYAPPDLTGLY